MEKRDRTIDNLRDQTRRRITTIENQRREAEMLNDQKQVGHCSTWLKYLNNVLEHIMCRNRRRGTSKTVYIAGKITGDDQYEKKFETAEKLLLDRGWRVMNPAKLPDDLEYEKYFPINAAMLDGADAIYLLRDYKESPGAMRELIYAGKRNIEIILEEGEKDELE